MARTNKTPIRLSKMAWSLASFASNKILMNGGHVDDASRLWKEDLEWLRREFYEGHFGFPWPAYPSPILRDDSAIAGKWNGTSRHFAALRNFVAIGGIADMAGLAAGSTRSRMTQLRPGRMEGGWCSALPGRAGISNAFSAAYSNRDRPVDVEQRRHSGIGCIGKSFI
jgi:hypothetical protein